MSGGKTGTLLWLSAILECDQLDPTETLLMVALADHVNAKDECFVGIEALARRARVSYGTARRRIKGLAEKGFIERKRRRRTDGNLSVYDFTLLREPLDLPARILRDDQRAPERAVTSAHPDARTEPPRGEQPRGEEDHARSEPSADDSFTQFWFVYPRKVSKGTARSVWARAVKAADGDAAPIIAGAERYRDDPNRVDQYTAHPSTWLNGERWNDPPLPPRGAAHQRTGADAYDPEREAERRSGTSGLVDDL